MKKALIGMAALTAVLAGCMKEADNPILERVDKHFTLKATVPDDHTKVVTDNGGAYQWQAGDKVTVLNTDGTPYEFATTVGGPTVDFSSATFDGTLSTEAMYPASENHASGKYYMEPAYDWVADASMMPMLGVVNTGTLTATFKSVGAVLKVPCYNVAATARKLVVSSDTKQLSGEFTPDGTPKAISTAAMSVPPATANNVITINFGSGHPTNMVFYIPMPTGNLGKLTFVMKDESNADVSVPTKTTANVELTRNQVVLVPALECNNSTILWKEDFTGYAADKEWTGANADGAIQTSGEYTAIAYGSASITYTTTNGGTTTKMYTDSNAGGISPELLISRNGDTPGSFVVKNIPTNGSSSMTLSFRCTNTIKLSATSGISVGVVATGAGKKTVTLTNSESLDSFNLTFYNDNSSNSRIDDILLYETPVALSLPSLTPASEALTILVGSSTATTSVTYANKVDDMPIAPVVNAEASSWLSAEVTGSYPTFTLTVTAASANNGADDRTGTVTLTASGVKKAITITQKTCLVSNPAAISVMPGDGEFTASWVAIPNATSYKAYLRTSEGTPTDGTDISASITGSGPYTISGYSTDITNGTTYYLYVKIDGVASGYEATSSYVMGTFTPAVGKGTSSNPFTVTEAQRIIAGLGKNGTTATDVYTSGIVVSLSGSLSSGKQSYYISDDGTTTGQLLVYRGKGISDASFTAGTVPESGDQVVVYGKLYYYNQITPEIKEGNYLNSLTKVHKMVLSLDTNILMAGAANSVQTLTITTNYDWTAALDDDATDARGTSYDVLNSSDVVIAGTISGTAGTTTIKFKSKGSGNGDGSTVTSFGQITFSDGTASETLNIKQSPYSAPTAVYTVTSTSTVSPSGSIPLGTSAVYSQTHATACQATSGNSFTLTLSGYDGKRITGLTLSMKSNTKGGSGWMYMARKNGEVLTNFATIATEADPQQFSNAVWNGAWSTEYVDIDVTVTPTTIGTSEDIKIYIYASASSLYCRSYTITYEDTL